MSLHNNKPSALDLPSRQQPRIQELTPRLHKILTIPDLEQMHAEFEQRRQHTPAELRDLLARHDIGFSDAQFQRLFLCMNTNRDNLCSWDEFVSHLLHLFRDDETYDQGKSLDLPIEEEPLFHKSHHRYPIVNIKFSPTIKPDRSVDHTTGNYITCSKDGTLIYWNQDFVMQYACKSMNPNLLFTKTWVTDFIPMPDVRIVCTSSIERDLRFYDTTAGQFHARVIITRMPFEVTCMAYHYGETENTDCKIVCGDTGGNVLLLEFCPKLRGPFQIRTGGGSFYQICWAEVLVKGCNRMRATKFTAVHRDIVRQVAYSVTLNCIFSAAECRTNELGKKPPPGLVITDLGISHKNTIIRMPKGVTTFAYNPDCTMIVTGGPDCMIRLWNYIIPTKPISILTGHHDGITFLFLQDPCNRIYSIDHARILKVWDGVEFALLQTFITISMALHMDRIPYRALYNENRRTLVLAGLQIVAVLCRPLLQLDSTDGYTHMRQVSVCLYNSLFRSVITCGYDSMIIVWDPLTGTRRFVIRQAHTAKSYGESMNMPITAGCFDPNQQLLITGARDGTLKIWNVNAGVCQRNLAIEPMCEVTSVIWLPNRILAIGWNKHITEFADSVDDVFGDLGKEWDTLHSDDVSCTAYYQPFYLATGSYATELVLWKLETGQPYRRIDIDTPLQRLKMSYEGAKAKLPAAAEKKRQSIAKMAFSRRTFQSAIKADGDGEGPAVYNRAKQLDKQKAERQRKLSIVQLPQSAQQQMKTAVHAMLFLTTRTMHEKRGTLVVALSTGFIQMYTHHPLAVKPFLQSFNGVHMAGDAITALATDVDNRYLITGTALGYIKTWMIQNYCMPKEEQVHINMPKLRLAFPFMTKERFLGRAKRTIKHLRNPILVNSFKGHLLSVTNLVYMDETKMMLSSSADKSARLWSAAGRYIGTFGSPVSWQPLVEDTPPPPDYPFRMPPDIKRIASSTTMKVFQGGFVEDPLAVAATYARLHARDLEVMVKPGAKPLVYGESLPAPILGDELPASQPWQPHYNLDMSMANIPIYKHLTFKPADIIKKPREPEQLTHHRTTRMRPSHTEISPNAFEQKK